MQLLTLFNNRSQELHVINSHVHQAVVILSGKTKKSNEAELRMCCSSFDLITMNRQLLKEAGV